MSSFTCIIVICAHKNNEAPSDARNKRHRSHALIALSLRLPLIELACFSRTGTPGHNGTEVPLGSTVHERGYVPSEKLVRSEVFVYTCVVFMLYIFCAVMRIIVIFYKHIKE